jgi:hypothetical protein
VQTARISLQKVQKEENKKHQPDGLMLFYMR